MEPERVNPPPEGSPPSSGRGPGLGVGVTGALAATAAATLVREELAHRLAGPMSFFQMLVKQLERGNTIAVEQVDIAKEELGRLQSLVSSMRSGPAMSINTKSVALAAILRSACKDVRASSSSVEEMTIEVADDVLVSVDTSAAGFVVFSVLSALVARNVSRIRLTLTKEADTTVTLTFQGAAPDAGVFASRAWAGDDGQALSFAIARRIARASGMRLKAPSAEWACIRLEFPSAAPGPL